MSHGAISDATTISPPSHTVIAPLPSSVIVTCSNMTVSTSPPCLSPLALTRRALVAAVTSARISKSRKDKMQHSQSYLVPLKVPVSSTFNYNAMQTMVNHISSEDCSTILPSPPSSPPPRKRLKLDDIQNSFSNVALIQRGMDSALNFFKRRRDRMNKNKLELARESQDKLDPFSTCRKKPTNISFQTKYCSSTVSENAINDTSVLPPPCSVTSLENTVSALPCGSTTVKSIPFKKNLKALQFNIVSDCLPPVLYTHKLVLPYTSTSICSSNPTSSVTISKESLCEKMKQEAWVSRRILVLCRLGLWSDRRLPKVAETKRIPSHWDSLIAEAQWLAVDYAQEKCWKKTAAKVLADSAKRYVERITQRKRLKAQINLACSKSIASQIAADVRLFWSKAAEVSRQYNRSIYHYKRRQMQDKPDCLSSWLVNGLSSRKSTIAQQETHEVVYDSKFELESLKNDIRTPLASLLRKNYPGVSSEYISLYEDMLFDEGSRQSYSSDESCDEDESSFRISIGSLLLESKYSHSVHKCLEDSRLGTDIAVIAEEASRYTPKSTGKLYTANSIQIPFVSVDLRAYQMIGVQWMINMYKGRFNAALADERGLGRKTQIVSFLSWLTHQLERHYRAKRQRNLLIVPSSSLYKWSAAFKHWCPTVACQVYGTNSSERLRKRSRREWSNAIVIITSYKEFFRDQKHFLSKRWNCAVIAEPQNLVYLDRSLFRLRCTFRLITLSTYLSNNVGRLWDLLHLLQPQTYFFREQNSFFPTSIEMVESPECINMVQQLQAVLSPFLLRRTFLQVMNQLPASHERVIKLVMGTRQRRMYDDYMVDHPTVKSGSDFPALHQICNLGIFEEYCSYTPPHFPMIASLFWVPKIIATVTTYNPFVDIDLSSLNFVFLTHETTLTAMTSDRIRKFAVNQNMMQNDEFWSFLSILPPAFGAEQTPCFHSDSLRIIASFNERRCNGMPLYGQDLIDSLKLKTAECSLNFRAGQGDLQCFLYTQSELVARSDTLNKLVFLHHIFVNYPSIVYCVYPKVLCTSSTLFPHLHSREVDITNSLRFLSTQYGVNFDYHAPSVLPYFSPVVPLATLSIKLQQLEHHLRILRNQNLSTRVVIILANEILPHVELFLRDRHFPSVYSIYDSDEKHAKTIEAFFNSAFSLPLLLVSKCVAPPFLSVTFPSSIKSSVLTIFLLDSCGSIVPDTATALWYNALVMSYNLDIIHFICAETYEDKGSDLSALNSDVKQQFVLNQYIINQAFDHQANMENGFQSAKFNCDTREQLCDATATERLSETAFTPINCNNFTDTNADVDDIGKLEEYCCSVDSCDSISIADSEDTSATMCYLDTSSSVERFAMSRSLELLSSSFDRTSLKPLTSLDKYDQRLSWEAMHQFRLACLSGKFEQENSFVNLSYSRSSLTDQSSAIWSPWSDLKCGGGSECLNFGYLRKPMTDAELPPIFIEDTTISVSVDESVGRSGANVIDSNIMPGIGCAHSAAKRLSDEVIEDQVLPKIRREDSVIPRSLFDRPSPTLLKARREPKTNIRGALLTANNFTVDVSSPGDVTSIRYPLPRPQVEADISPDWTIQEDWVLYKTIHDLQKIPINLSVVKPSHTANWDLISDMTQAVARSSRNMRQCRFRYENIIIPREEGRIIYDISLTSKKTKKNKTSLSMKTSQLYEQEDHSNWYESCLGVVDNIASALKKMEPLGMAPPLDNLPGDSIKHSSILTEASINYDSPLSPIQVAANRAERIHKEKQRSQESIRAQAAIVRYSAGGTISPAVTQPLISGLASSAPAQAVVVGISQPVSFHPVIGGQQTVAIASARLQTPVSVHEALLQGQPSVVVTTSPALGASLTQGQLAAAQKYVNQTGIIKSGVAMPTRTLTTHQINLLRQQALHRKGNELTVSSTSSGAPLSSVLSSSRSQQGTLVVAGQKVSLSTSASPFSSSLVAAANVSSHNKGHVIRHMSPNTFVSGNRSIPPNQPNVRSMLDSDVKVLLSKSKVGVTTPSTPSSAHLLAQAGIQVQQGSISSILGTSTNQNVTTIVKTSGGSQFVSVQPTANSLPVSVPLPISSIHVPHVRATIARSNQTQLLHRQLLKTPRGGGSIATIPGIANVLVGTSQKVGLSPKSIPTAQVIVQGNKNLTQSVTVQQIQHMVASVKPTSSAIQHLVAANQIPVSASAFLSHSLLATKQPTLSASVITTTSPVQARIVPTSSSMKPNQQIIQVMNAPPGTRCLTGPVITVPSSSTIDTPGRTTICKPTQLQPYQLITGGSSPISVAVRNSDRVPAVTVAFRSHLPSASPTVISHGTTTTTIHRSNNVNETGRF